jgi:hypothetical protein
LRALAKAILLLSGAGAALAVAMLVRPAFAFERHGGLIARARVGRLAWTSTIGFSPAPTFGYELRAGPWAIAAEARFDGSRKPRP